MDGPVEVKICIIGDSDAGKTSLSMRYCHGQFPENSSPTIGASFLQKRITVDGIELAFQIWDTAGQERFRSMAPMYYRGAKAAVLVFDLGNETSLQHSITWLKDLKQHADPDVVVCLAGNKCDKPSEVDPRKIEEIARSMEAKFVKCSALTGEGVDAVFSTLAQGILSNYKGKLGRASEKQLNLSDKLSKDNDDGSGSLCC